MIKLSCELLHLLVVNCRHLMLGVGWFTHFISFIGWSKWARISCSLNIKQGDSIFHPNSNPITGEHNISISSVLLFVRVPPFGENGIVIEKVKAKALTPKMVADKKS